MGLASSLGRARYRVRQFTRGVRPFLAPSEVEAARAHLSPGEFALFLGAEARDRRHSVDLFHALQAAGAGEAELVAALLHDVGKGRLRTWHRIAFVLLNAAVPRLARRLEAPVGARWRVALWRLRHHARLSADLLAAAGSDPHVVELVRGHTEPPPPDHAVMARFIAFDNRL